MLVISTETQLTKGFRFEEKLHKQFKWKKKKNFGFGR